MCGSYSYVRGNTPKMGVSEVMSYLKGKSALCFMIESGDADKMGDRTFMARGYYVATVGM